MVITSRNESKFSRRYGSSQFNYAMVYVLVTFVVLFLLNFYTSKTSQQIFYQSKETSMIEKCQLAAEEISNLEVINSSTVANAVSQMSSLRVTRLVVTDLSGVAIYDSAGEPSSYVLFPEVIKALEGNDVFSWQYQDGAMHSHAATPIMSYGVLNGCVYMMEYDIMQGSLIYSLENNILTITIVLALFLLLFSLVFSQTFSRRLNRIMSSMRIIREGDYSHKVNMGGNDELSVLGKEFNILTDRLQTSERKRRQFVSDASHELKTPLASIKLLSDSILQNDMDMETVREFVGDIGNEAERLNRMSEKLLSLSSIESQSDENSEIIYIAPTINRVCKMLSVIAQKNSITIHQDIRQDSPILIQEDDLYQIIFNLAENGIKYNAPGGSLTLCLYRVDENAILDVTDTGVGIPEDAIGHVFERFYRVDKARSRKSGGSGLGLSIVRNMVQRSRGEISVESTFGKGSTFRISFPVFDTEEAQS